MGIWFKKDLSLADLVNLGRDTLGEHLGMEWSALGEDSLSARMPVDKRTKQPYGLLHGGASVALAETLGSVAAALVVDSTKFYCVGTGNKRQPREKCPRWLCYRNSAPPAYRRQHTCLGYKDSG